MERYRVELTAENLDCAEYALKELERHQQGVADELFGPTGLSPNKQERAAYLDRAEQARDTRRQLAAAVRLR